MTLYMLSPELGSPIYAGSALAEAASAAVSGARIALGFQLAYVAALSVFFSAVILLCAKCFPQEPSSSVDRATPSAWRELIVVVAVLLCVGGIAVLIAATGDPGHALACAGPCGAAPDAIVGEDTSATAGRSPSVVVDGELQALFVGITLFEERGCAGCHKPDTTGVGPTLHGLFGSPVQYPESEAGIVDESYLREAILNPSATVANGFTPVMQAFAGQLTEEQLQALVV